MKGGNIICLIGREYGNVTVYGRNFYASVASETLVKNRKGYVYDKKEYSKSSRCYDAWDFSFG